MKRFSLFFPGVFLLSFSLWVWVGPIPCLFAADSSVRILFLGDSISAGLGVEPEYARAFYEVFVSLAV
ncbi:MAG: hypothetical protein DRH34_03035 [Deltaproteobacteria bacterium]|nr:MAG: hypothetical protein DRH34_03035 [Deltaproteobacteria bacterium]